METAWAHGTWARHTSRDVMHLYGKLRETLLCACYADRQIDGHDFGRTCAQVELDMIVAMICYGLLCSPSLSRRPARKPIVILTGWGEWPILSHTHACRHRPKLRKMNFGLANSPGLICSTTGNINKKRRTVRNLSVQGPFSPSTQGILTPSCWAKFQN